MRKLLPHHELQQLTCIARKLNSAVDGVEECAKIIKICSKLFTLRLKGQWVLRIVTWRACEIDFNFFSLQIREKINLQDEHILA